MEVIDATTGQPLPPDAIQRLLFISQTVHVYNIPPRPSNKGHTASKWTEELHIFTARLRLLETSYASTLKVDLVLENASNGELFAACPYDNPNAVEPALDSSRFFAITVRDPTGRKAVLGMGFEERSESFDFGVALQEARRGLGWEAKEGKKAEKPDKDYSLKEGETITVQIGNTGIGRRRKEQNEEPVASGNLQSFALAPPPGSGSGGAGGFGLPPPPSASDVKKKRMSAQELGFDDGQNGEFA